VLKVLILQIQKKFFGGRPNWQVKVLRCLQRIVAKKSSKTWIKSKSNCENWSLLVRYYAHLIQIFDMLHFKGTTLFLSENIRLVWKSPTITNTLDKYMSIVKSFNIADPKKVFWRPTKLTGKDFTMSIKNSC
jgi:hypothetical protein